MRSSRIEAAQTKIGSYLLSFAKFRRREPSVDF
jgi:hypothetical protein